jgi:acyl-homoserine-lactone acylase
LKVYIHILFFLFLINSTYSQIDPYNVEIVRGKYGTPHIFGQTDADAAFGLAWAHAEDDFKTIQETFLPSKSLMGHYLGKEGVKLDYISQLLKCEELVEKEIDNFSPKLLSVLDGYVQGLNAYAKKFPNKVLVKKSFPMTAKEYLVGFNFVIHFFSDISKVLKDLYSNDIPLIQDSVLNNIGSNGFAFKKSKTLENKTFININTHQPLEGPFSWYEAHLHSQEGWNMLGGLFPGSPFPFIGTNENIAWTHTYNYPDLIDIYQMQIHPHKKKYYLFDDEWIKFDVSRAKLSIKLKNGIVIPLRKKILWSNYGPVVKNDSGVFSFHLNALENIAAIEQWYEMNKASNFEEFKQALEIMGIPRFNIVYADREDNIFYMSNGQIPLRDSIYNWNSTLPGNTSRTKTKGCFSIADLPTLENPNSGYIFNTNNTPYNCTFKEDNLIETNFHAALGYREKYNNRSLRFEELISGYDKVSYEDFVAIKYDQQYANPIFCPFKINKVFEVDYSKEYEISEITSIIQNWNRRAEVYNFGAAHFSIFFKFLRKNLKKSQFDYEKSIPDSILINNLIKTKNYILKNFGNLDITLGDYQKHVRANVEIPIGGLVDMIAESSSKNYKDGKVKIVKGDSYIMLVQFGEGLPVIETVLPYGISNDPASPHFTDQMSLYASQNRKKMSLKKEVIYKNASKIYHPK